MTDQTLGVHFEAGRLRHAIVCNPGLAHRRLTRENCEELLFDDAFWVRHAQKDHDVFTDVMRRGRGRGARYRGAAVRDARHPQGTRLDGRIAGCGSGGVPVIARADSSLTGVQAVIDKDAASALLTEGLGASVLLLLTDVDGIYRDGGTDATARFAAGGQSRIAGVGTLGDATGTLESRAGNRITSAKSA